MSLMLGDFVLTERLPRPAFTLSNPRGLMLVAPPSG
jgi:hypothetical protein